MRNCCGRTNASRPTSDAEVSTRCPLHRSPRCSATSKRTKLACGRRRLQAGRFAGFMVPAAAAEGHAQGRV